MRELKELKEEFPKVFEGCYTDYDFKEKLRTLHTSCEIYHSEDIIPGLEMLEIEGYYILEVIHNSKRPRNFVVIKIITENCLYDWSDEDNCYTAESYCEIGWEIC